MPRLFYDYEARDGREPRRGDVVQTSRSLYHIIGVRRVRRRDPRACSRYMLTVIRDHELEPKTRALLGAAAARYGGLCVFPLFWYPRESRIDRQRRRLGILS